MIDFLAYLTLRLLVAVIGCMPTDMGDSLCRRLAWLLAIPMGVRRKSIDETYARVFEGMPRRDQQTLTLAMWRHLLVMVCEIVWAQRRIHRCNWGDYVQFRGNREMLLHLLDVRPTVMVTGHFGNFEVGGYLLGVMGLRTTSIARRLDNAWLHAWVTRFRSAKGQDMVDKQGCAADIDAHLNAGGTLSLLADQHAGSKGLWMDFCGVPASCHKALALFTLTSGAPMLVGYTRRLGTAPMQFESCLVDAADPANDRREVTGSTNDLTRWYNQTLEQIIDTAPEQYWWLHRRWRDPPNKAKLRLDRQRQTAKMREASQTRAA
ncbi:MAG: lysophospholipid acyltransferase family protein [Planctomycetota bacterium]